MQGPGVLLTYKPLDESCEIGDFSCGEESWAQDLDDFIHNDALPQQKDLIGSTFVFYQEDQAVAYVCLAATNILMEDTPSLRKRKGLERVRYPHIPAVLIARLAVDRRFQRRGIGAWILAWVREQVHDWAVGCRFLALHVERQNDRAIRFYQREGFFVPLEEETHPSRDLQLMLFDLLAD